MNFFHKNFKEIGLFLGLLLSLFLASHVVRWLDPTAGVLDLGWLQLVLAGVLKASLGIVALWLLLTAGFPTLRDYAENEAFRADFFLKLPPEHRAWIFVALVLGLLAFIAVCLSIA